MNKKTCNTIVAHGATQAKQSHQLCLPLESLEIHATKPHKPQISSIPGISPKERDRYRVVLGREILGERLTLDEAIALANKSTHL
jgi:hypothetical protein